MLLGYGYYRSTDSTTGLPRSACCRLRPWRRWRRLFGGLIWRRANARGAILGLSSGFLIWAYLLFLPSLGGPNYTYVSSAVLSFIFPGAGVFAGPAADPLVNATVLSLLVNTAAFVLGSLTRNARPLERIQAGIFVKRHSRSQFATRDWKTRVSVGDLKTAIARYLGEERMQRSFNTYERTAGRRLEDDQPADIALIHFSEQLLGSAIGSSSARLVLSLILQKMEDASSDTAWLLDQQARPCNTTKTCCRQRSRDGPGHRRVRQPQPADDLEPAFPPASRSAGNRWPVGFPLADTLRSSPSGG